MTLRNRRPAAAWLIALFLVVAGCAAPAASAPAPPDAAEISAELNALPVVPRPRDDGTYRRAYFGKAWVDTEGSKCRQRADVLYRDVDRSRPYTTRRSGRCTHEMLAGTWTDPYTGESRTFADLRDSKQAEQIPVDHRLSARSTRALDQDC